MMLTSILSALRRWWRPVLSGFAVVAAALTLSAAEAAKKNFDLPAGPAGETLKAFARQAGREIVFSAETVGAVSTKPVKGDLAPREAIDLMLEDTGLIATQDAKTGAFAVRKAMGSEAKNVPSRTQTPNRADESGSTVTLERYVVTGSRITQLEGAGPQPTAAYTQGEITERGYLSLGDFMQSLSFNSGTTNAIGVPAANPVSNVPFARGAVTMNPRGLGANRFLVLIDGKRPSAYGLADNRGGSVFDFNSIPTEAIAGIEYLKDGASAIYGSDAVAGVMNIKLRSTYSGVTVSALAGNTLGHDTFSRSLSLVTGGVTAHGSYLLNVNWFRQNANFAMDYDRSRSTDYSAFPSPRGQNNNSTSNWPFNLTLTAAQATAAGFTTGAGGYVITGGQPVANPTLASFSSVGSTINNATNANRYDFAPLTQLLPAQENYSALFNAKQAFSDRVTGTAQLLVNRNRTGIVYTPISINSTAITTSDGTPLTVPVSNPFNPFGFALTNFRGRGNFGPTRTFDVESTGLTLMLGLDTKLWRDWDGSVNFTRSESTVDQVAGNQIRTDDMQRALNGTLPGFVGKFFNPFGPSDPALVKALYVSSTPSSRTQTTGGEVSASGPLFDMPALAGHKSAGPVAVAVGAEWRQDRLTNNADPVGYLVTVGDLPYAGRRTVASGYAELSVPVLPKYLSLQIATRYDHYDSFGGTTNPKFALISQPVGFVKIRASYSKSFKAPEIGQLYQPAVTTFTTAIVDPLNPGLGTNTYPFIASGNRNLQPERGHTWYAGAMFDLGKAVKGLTVSADYFDIGLTNVITSFTSPTTFFNLFPNLVVRTGAGTIQYFNAQTINAAGYKWKGADFSLDYRRAGTPVGDLTFNAQATYVDYFALDAGAGAGYVNTAGRYNTPRLAGSTTVGWKRDHLSAALSMQYKGTYLNDQFSPAWQENSARLFNGSVTWQAPARTQVTLGCNNLFDTEPPQNGKAIPSYGFDIATYAAWSMGRFVYVKIKKDF